MLSSLLSRCIPYMGQGVTATGLTNPYHIWTEDELIAQKCVGCNRIYKYWCPEHWRQYAEERMEDILEAMGTDRSWCARFSMRHIYNFEQDGTLMRRFFWACCHKYARLRYVWVKHLTDDVYVHWHVLFWQKDNLDMEYIRGRYKRLLNKYTAEGYSMNDAYIEPCRMPAKHVSYMLGLTTARNSNNNPPWGELYGHVVDGNGIYHARRHDESRFIPY